MVSSIKILEGKKICKAFFNQEEDLLHHSKKKGKVGVENVTMENVYVVRHEKGGLCAYKDKLLKPLTGSILWIGDVEMNVEENLLEGIPKDVVLNLCKLCDGQMIPLSEEELVSWISPWRIMLVVNVLGKRLIFRLLR